MPGLAGHERPTEPAMPATHRQLTTGDAGRFREVAVRLFGPELPETESIELGMLVP